MLNLIKPTWASEGETPPAAQPPVPPVMPGQHLRDAGVMMLVDEFKQETIMPLVAQIIEYNLMPDEMKPDVLTLIINSPGGRLDSAFHLIDMMNDSAIPVVTIGHGMVASCGVLTLMAGAKGARSITTNTSVMSHQYSGGTMGKEHELYARVKDFEMTSDKMVTHYRHCTKKSESYIRKHLLHQTDEFMTPWECLKHGIVDEVIDTYTGTSVNLKELKAIEKKMKEEG